MTMSFTIPLLFTYLSILACGHVIDTEREEFKSWGVEKVNVKMDDLDFPILSYSSDGNVASSIKRTGKWRDMVYVDEAFKFITDYRAEKGQPEPVFDYCVDVGANLGFMTIQMVLRGCKHVDAIEAIYTDILGENISMNNLTSQISIKKVAVGNGQGKLYYKLSKTNPAATTLYPQSAVKPKELSSYTSIDVVRLETSIAPNLAAYQKVALMKMDIEGNETEVLASSLNLFKKGIIENLILETHDKYGVLNADRIKLLTNTVKKIVKEHGYGMYIFDTKREFDFKKDKLGAGNYLIYKKLGN